VAFWHATATHGDLIEAFLFTLADEPRSVHVDYRADEAFTQVACLRIAARRCRRYPAIGERLGSERADPGDRPR
jgi:hypothetical protein